MLENKLINGIHVSRYIASWTNVGGEVDDYRPEEDLENLIAWLKEEGMVLKKSESFCAWLRSLGISEDDNRYICCYAMCGKMELESVARKFRKQ